MPLKIVCRISGNLLLITVRQGRFKIDMKNICRLFIENMDKLQFVQIVKSFNGKIEDWTTNQFVCTIEEKYKDKFLEWLEPYRIMFNMTRETI